MGCVSVLALCGVIFMALHGDRLRCRHHFGRLAAAGVIATNFASMC